MIKIKITEGHACGACDDQPSNYKNTHNGEEARLHRTTLAHLEADVKVLLDLVKDEDDLPGWLEAKITKAGDYMSSAARHVAGNVARDRGQLEEQEDIEVSMERQEMIQILARLPTHELANLLSQAELGEEDNQSAY